jgi:hypothetical protein
VAEAKNTNSRLQKDQVRYLSLEGGGGKGFAFVGALAALENPLGILSYALRPAAPSAAVYTTQMVAAIRGPIAAAGRANQRRSRGVGRRHNGFSGLLRLLPFGNWRDYGELPFLTIFSNHLTRAWCRRSA